MHVYRKNPPCRPNSNSNIIILSVSEQPDDKMIESISRPYRDEEGIPAFATTAQLTRAFNFLNGLIDFTT